MPMRAEIKPLVFKKETLYCSFEKEGEMEEERLREHFIQEIKLYNNKKK